MIMVRLLKALIALAAAGYVAAAGYMTLYQRDFLYRVAPEAAPISDAVLPRASSTILAVADGVQLTAWTVEPSWPDRPVFVYFHGNAGNLIRRTERFRLMTEDGSGLFAIHYRGYGGSQGQPTEADLHRDAHAAYDEAARRYPGRRLVIVGESLGSGVAVKLGSEVAAAAVILDSPYVSVLDRAASSYPWLPVSWLLTDTFRSDQWIRAVRAPLLILHGEKDRVIPFEDGKRLFALANEPKSFVPFAEAGHVGGFRFGAMTSIRAFLAEAAAFPR